MTLLVTNNLTVAPWGMQRKWPEKFYSALAGFIEPGESFEDAVKREIWEEAGVRAWDVQYHSTQPWVRPSSTSSYQRFTDRLVAVSRQSHGRVLCDRRLLGAAAHGLGQRARRQAPYAY